jgi:DNA-binding response OmpR family regulator
MGGTVAIGGSVGTKGRKRLLVIDDEQSICDFVKRVAEVEGFEVTTVVTHDQFNAAYDSFNPTAILLDLVMPQVDGIALLEKLADRQCKAKLLIMTGYHPELLKSGARIGDGYDLDMRGTLHKPFGIADLQAALRRLA